jgi:pimeloyl-ACP methyl ester carboxylesterase
VARLATLTAALRAAPLAGRAPDSHGRRRRIVLDAPSLAALVSNATYEWQIYRELDPAVRAALDGDPTPLLRLAGEQRAGASRPRDYSQALENAVSCADYPRLYDMSAPPAVRRTQLDTAIAALPPDTFAPFDLPTWLASPFSDHSVCLDWPAADMPVPPYPTPRTYPDVPVLVLNGDLDTITPSVLGQQAAAHFPRATFVEVANAVHVTALGSVRDCATDLVREFVATGAVADASCAAAAPPVRILDAFWSNLDAIPGADLSARRRTAALATLADVLNRRPALYGSRGNGLRGGRYRFITGFASTGVRLRGVELIPGVPVDGDLVWDETADMVEGRLTIADLELTVRWRPVHDDPTAAVSGGGWSGDVPVP